MILENIKEASRVKSIFMIIPVIFTVAALTIILLDVENGYWIVGGMAAVMVMVFISITLMQYRYFYCEISQQRMLFRFHGLGPLNSDFKSYKIRPEQFKTYKIDTVMFGLVPRLTIFVRVRGEVAKYPPISISALTKEQREQLEKGLSLLETINKSNK
jgi:hypothetical protein